MKDLSRSGSIAEKLLIERKNDDQMQEKWSVRDVMSNYLTGCRAIFSNPTIFWIFMGTCFSTWQSQTVVFFQAKYFQVYPEQNTLYATLNSFASFIGSLTSNIITALVIECFGEYAMSRSLICIVKCIFAIPCCAMIFM